MEKKANSLENMLSQFDPLKHGGEVMSGKEWLRDTLRMAIDVFNDHDKATQWLREPNASLGNVAPTELLADEQGAHSVRLVLNAIATGGVV